MTATKDKLFGFARRGSVEVDGIGSVGLCTFGYDKLEEWQREYVKDGASKVRATAALIVLGTCNGDGGPLFTDADIPRIMAMPMELAEKLAAAVAKHNALGDEAAIVEGKA